MTDTLTRALAFTAALAVAVGCSDTDPAIAGSDGSAPAQADASTSDAALARDAEPSFEPERSELPLPQGAAGIGFDDLQYSATLDRVIVPAGRAGYVALIDPRSEQITHLGRFSTTDVYAGGHGFGTTSAIEAEGLIYAVDRTALELQQLDPRTGDTLGTVSLGGSPDYVRFVAATRELWVTEPTAQRFEIFSLGADTPPTLTQAGELAVSGGPESMAVTADGATAYTNTFIGETIRIDTAARSETARWRNGCAGSLGLTLDEASERIFVGCAAGKGVSLDAADGTVLSMLVASRGVDVIAYSQELRHLYLNGSAVGELTVAGVDTDGTLTELASVTTAPSSGSSCVASDPYHNIWVCDANRGQLLRIADIY